MTIKPWTFLLASIFLSLDVAAQTPTTPPVCYRRCNDVPLKQPEEMDSNFFASVRKIQEKKKSETDPAKIQELDEAEKEAMDRILGKHRKFCSKLCKYDD
ncbi:hypothetical protein [Undibacterium terreum]|nr:hypothetical protein [Undibacterium terreum]